MHITAHIAEAYEDYVFDQWQYKDYLLIGGYGAGRTYHTAYKLIMRLYEEKQNAIVAAPDMLWLYRTFLSCKQVLSDLGVLANENQFRRNIDKVRAKWYEEKSRKKATRIIFHNGSKIWFVPLDAKPDSYFFHGVKTVWISRAHLTNQHAIQVLIDRLRDTKTTANVIYTANATGKDNWLYKQYFREVDYDEVEYIKLDEYVLYDSHSVTIDDTYMLHTTISDNPFTDKMYLMVLNKLQSTDNRLYMRARWGRFTGVDRRIFPHLEVVWRPTMFWNNVHQSLQHYYGLCMDGKTVVCVTENPNRTQNGLLIYDKVDLTDNGEIAVNWKARMIHEHIPIYVYNGMDNLVVDFWLNKGYNIQYTEQPIQYGIQKLQQFVSIQVAPEQDKMYREVKGLVYKYDDNNNPLYDEYLGDTNYIYGIANVLSQIDITFTHRTII